MQHTFGRGKVWHGRHSACRACLATGSGTGQASRFKHVAAAHLCAIGRCGPEALAGVVLLLERPQHGLDLRSWAGKSHREGAAWWQQRARSVVGASAGKERGHRGPPQQCKCACSDAPATPARLHTPGCAQPRPLPDPQVEHRMTHSARHAAAGRDVVVNYAGRRGQAVVCQPQHVAVPLASDCCGVHTCAGDRMRVCPAGAARQGAAPAAAFDAAGQHALVRPPLVLSSVNCSPPLTSCTASSNWIVFPGPASGPPSAAPLGGSACSTTRVAASARSCSSRCFCDTDTPSSCTVERWGTITWGPRSQGSRRVAAVEGGRVHVAARCCEQPRECGGLAAAALGTPAAWLSSTCSCPCCRNLGGAGQPAGIAQEGERMPLQGGAAHPDVTGVGERRDQQLRVGPRRVAHRDQEPGRVQARRPGRVAGHDGKPVHVPWARPCTRQGRGIH